MSLKIRWPTWVLAGAALISVIWYVSRESERPSPGPLHPSHATVAELSDCSACHGDSGSFETACLACHEDIATARAEQRGLHGRDTATPCEHCHLDHRGAALDLAGPTAFQAAGIASQDAFDHERDADIPLDLSGRHDELECVACHKLANDARIAEGERRFRGLTQNCTRCHEDSHEGAFGDGCAACHGQQAPFEDHPPFTHTALELQGAHADVACADCHAADGPNAVAALAGTTGLAVRACGACHPNVHAGVAVEPRVDTIFLGAAEDCSRCHEPTKFSDAQFGAAEHEARGVLLEGGHATAECAGCHRADRPLASTLERCRDCHDDPHATLQTGVAGAPPPPPVFVTDVSCARCHTPEAFRPATRTARDHGSFAAELPGKHAEAVCADCHATPSDRESLDDCAPCHETPHNVAFATTPACDVCHRPVDPEFRTATATLDPSLHSVQSLAPPHDLPCDSCHAPAESFAARYPGRAADDCAACHGDPHGGRFAEGVFAAETCRGCHAPDRFTPSTFDTSRHAQARFALDGAHLAVPCVRCHEGTGATRTFRNTRRECVACHDDVHSGTFDRVDLPRTVQGRAGCARCHDTARFRGVDQDFFEHGTWTGRALTGAHAEASCVRCHGREGDGSLGTAPDRCSACHEDIHRGQFARDGGTDCARCHIESDKFTDLDFDHALDTAFVLDADHAKLSCDSCHRDETTADGARVVRYRPLGTLCRDCHAPAVRTGQEGR